MKAKYITETSEDYKLLDKNTGELLDYKQTKKVTMDEFIMIFFASYPELLKMKGQKLKVLMLCWKYSTYGNPDEGNVFINDKVFKDHVREYEPSMTDGAIDVAISELSKRGLLLKQCRGRYILNKNYFFKGKLSDRSRLKMSFVVDGKDEAGKPVKKSVCFFCYSKILEDVEGESRIEEIEQSLLE